MLQNMQGQIDVDVTVISRGCMRLLFYRLLSCVVLIALSSQIKAELILTAPPREQAETGEKLYGPLAKHLTELLGEKVTYVYPNNWLEYQRDLRKDVYDIVFDGPHFVSWRLTHLKHDVLVKLPGTLEFVVIVNADDKEVKNVNDLIGKKICGIPPPNLATLTVIDQFPNPVRQPVIWGIDGGYMDVFRAFASGQCRAAVFRSTFFEKKLTEQDRSNTRVLFRSKALPNQAISVSSRVNAEAKNKIIKSLTAGNGMIATKSISRRFGGQQAKPFVSATKEEYEAPTQLLEGIVFGW